jgi:hypothetical protein
MAGNFIVIAISLENMRKPRKARLLERPLDERSGIKLER